MSPVAKHSTETQNSINIDESRIVATVENNTGGN